MARLRSVEPSQKNWGLISRPLVILDLRFAIYAALGAAKASLNSLKVGIIADFAKLPPATLDDF